VRISVRAAISIIMELLLIYAAMCEYYNWIAIPLVLPVVLLVRILFSFFISHKMVHIPL
jgi:hypothetical protein